MRHLLVLLSLVMGCAHYTVLEERDIDREALARASPISLVGLRLDTPFPLSPESLIPVQKAYLAALLPAASRTDLLAVEAEEDARDSGALVVAVLTETPRQRAFSQAMELVPGAELSVFILPERRLIYAARLELVPGGNEPDGSRGLRAAASTLGRFAAERLSGTER